MVKFFCQAGHSYNEIAKQVSYTKSTTQRISTYVKKQFTGEKVENRQVKKSFLIGTKEL